MKRGIFLVSKSNPSIRHSLSQSLMTPYRKEQNFGDTYDDDKERTNDFQIYRPLPLLLELVNYNVFNRNYIFFPKAKAKEVSMY